MAVEAIAVDIDGTITDDKRRICISSDRSSNVYYFGNEKDESYEIDEK